MIKNIAVVFGGRSCEHEISILSALQVMSALDKKYHIVPIYISKDAQLYSGKDFKDLSFYKNLKQLLKKKDRIILQRDESEVYCIKGAFNKTVIDFVIPVMHGMNGEDGALQGYLEILNIPYGGSNMLSCAMAQSKVSSKIILQNHHIPTLDYNVICEGNIKSKFLPAIIKPDRLGSSIGIQIVRHEKEWESKCHEALLYDEQCIVEPFIEKFREINCSVMKVHDEIVCSSLEEVAHEDDILSFKNKYEGMNKKGSGSHHLHPELNESIEADIKEIAKKVYQCFRFEGLIRIDFMLIDDVIYVNEINTTPGSYAFYLWEHKNMEELLEEVIREGILVYQRKLGQITSFDSEVLFHYQGSKK